MMPNERRGSTRAVLLDKRLAWAPMTLSLAASGVLGVFSLLQKDTEVRGGLWFLVGSLVLAGLVRATYWRYIIGEVSVLVDRAGSSVMIARRGREVARIELDDLAKIDTALGVDWPEFSRWAVFPRIVFETKHGSACSQKVVMRDNRLRLSARDLAAELHVPGPDD